MPDATLLQSSFLGGEWSPYAQGRVEDQRYRTGMNVCRNELPVEEGAATRRPGTRLAAATRSGAPAVLRNFDFEQQHPYSLELTAGHMRFFSGPALIYNNADERVVLAVSAATPAVIQTTAAHGYTTGDQVLFKLVDGEAANAGVNPLLGREFSVTVTDTTHFAVHDALTGAALDGSTVTLGATDLLAEKIVDVATPYLESELQAINTVQDQQDLLLLHGSHYPRVLQSTTPETSTDYAVFSFSTADFLDGPYLDPVTDGAVITPSATTGSITLTISGGTTRWASTDVGRLVRLFSAPAAWDSATAYTAGQQVEFNGAYYVASAASTNVQPDTDPVKWAVDTSAAGWTWAQITAYTSATVVTATIRGPDLQRTTPDISLWRLGLFSDTTGYPTCGVFHEGRLWLSGVVGNRIDGSKSDDYFNFEPTAADGTVADDNACAYVFRSTSVNAIFWMISDNKGIVCGTQAGEWVVQASDLNDPLTPTSIQAHRYTDYGCANIPAVRAGLAIAFVQRFKQTVLEYITTDSRGFTARNMSATGKHLTSNTGVAEIAYQKERVPVVWARTVDNKLIGCTYQRESPYASDAPDFAGWHRHDLGNGFEVVSIQTGPSFLGDLDALSMIAKDTTTGYHYVYVLTDVFDENNVIGDAYFVDMGVGPPMAEILTDAGVTYLRLYGLWRLEGVSVAAFIGGVDAGNYTVTNGTISIPLDTVGLPLLTLDYLRTLTSSTNFRGFGLSMPDPAAGPGTANQMSIAGLSNVTPPSGAVEVFTFQPGLEAVDWDNGIFYTNAYGGAGDGLRAINLSDFSTIVEFAWASGTPNFRSMICDVDNRLIAFAQAGNCATIYRIDTATLSDVTPKTFGAVDFNLDTAANRFSAPSNYVAIQSGDGHNYLVSCSFLLAEVAVMDLDLATDGVSDGISWTGFSFTPDENRDAPHVCRGPHLGNTATAYVVAINNASDGVGSTSADVGIYRVECPGGLTMPTMTKLGTLSVTDLFGVGDWLHYNSIGFVVADETSGHEGIMIHFNYVSASAWAAGTTYKTGDCAAFSGHDWKSLQNANLGNSPDVSPTFWQDLGVSHAGTDPGGGGSEEKIVKVEISGSTLSVVWRQQVFGAPSESAYVNQSRVRYGRYGFVGSISVSGSAQRRVYDIQTIDGTTVERDVDLLSATAQHYDDYTGRLIFRSGWGGHDASPPVGVTSPVQTGSLASWASGAQFAMFTRATAPLQPPADPPIASSFLTVPVAIGYTYTSQGQILRPISPQESGAANGPALSKTRRTHSAGFLFHNAQGVEVGTVFGETRPADFSSPDGTTYPLTTLFSGIYWNTLENDYDYDSMICWEITRPYPATVLAVSGFLHTQDR